MVIARISNLGLSTMAVLVLILWGCLIGERLTVGRANSECYRVLQDLQHRRNNTRQRQPSNEGTGRPSKILSFPTNNASAHNADVVRTCVNG